MAYTYLNGDDGRVFRNGQDTMKRVLYGQVSEGFSGNGYSSDEERFAALSMKRKRGDPLDPEDAEWYNNYIRKNTTRPAVILTDQSRSNQITV